MGFEYREVAVVVEVRFGQVIMMVHQVVDRTIGLLDLTIVFHSLFVSATKMEPVGI
jgi:hypothetical protein